MYQCSNCGSGLKYDIETGQLLCNHCGTYFNPYSIDRESDGYEQDYFEATHFVCPQCGGEILSTDNAAAGFCSYCGASTILTSRISREQRPARIVPFKVTKEQCHGIFKKRMRKAIFAPKGFKSSGSIESFRGIYMPYWLYRTRQMSSISLKGEKKYRQGNYRITDYYDVTANVNAEYNGFYYDASSAFYDNISEPLAPFDFSDSMDFAPSFYSGFYADIPDVPREVYEDDAISESDSATFNMLCSNSELKGFDMNTTGNKTAISQELNTRCDVAQGVMLPVWFMSYRSGDRVAYATVNGQTGKIVTDVPVDKRKYIAGSIILAVPIFLLLNFLFTILPSITMILTSILAGITSIILYNEMSSIYKKENNIDDKGINWVKRHVRIERRNSGNTGPADNIEAAVNKVILTGTVCVMLSVFMPVILANMGVNVVAVIKTIIPVIGVIISYMCFIISKKKFNGLEVRGKNIYLVPIISNVIATIIFIINPVSDIYYYTGALISIIAVIIVFMAIIGNYNILCMRYLPQFDKQGGDDNA